MNEKVLLSHPGGRKHKERLEDCEQVKSFFRPKNATDITKEPNKTSGSVIITTPVDSVSAAGSTSCNASHTKSLDACFEDLSCQNIKIMWAFKHAYNGLSDKSARNVDLLKTIFPHSKVAEKMQLESPTIKVYS